MKLRFCNAMFMVCAVHSISRANRFYNRKQSIRHVSSVSGIHISTLSLRSKRFSCVPHHRLTSSHPGTSMYCSASKHGRWKFTSKINGMQRPLLLELLSK
uniref:Putative hipothetical protein n=1 Tax=Ixodes ricinus TaxID=34613 RepID=A0A147BJB5_IXORI